MRAHPPLRVKQVLLTRGIQHQDFAERLGVTSNWLSQVLNGHKKPSITLARLMAHELGIPEAELFDEAVSL